MEIKNILIALDILDIGGVETFVCNQSVAMKKKGYNVHILSKKGVFTEVLQEKDINCIEFDFVDKNYYDFDKIEKILEIFEKYNIKEVHINQFSAMNVLMPACLIANIPYIVYLHMASGIIDNEKLNAYNYYESHFCTYTENFKLLFKYAYKIVAITPDIKDYTIKRFGIEDKSKCIVIPNSINFDEYKTKNKVNQIKNILIVSRISFEKLNVIINGIKLYQEIKQKSKEKVKLTIAGDGKETATVKEYIKYNRIQDITFLGKVSDISKVLEKHDLLIGVDRCVLEAITMKRLAVVSGYDGFKGLLKNEITTQEIEENFCGKNLKERTIEDVANEIVSLKQNEIENIVEENYKQIRQKLDINKNVYIADQDSYKYKIEMATFIKSISKINYALGKSEEEARDKVESIWKDHIEYQKWIEPQLEELKRNGYLKEESRIIRKIKNILKRILKKLRLYN